MNQLDIFGDLSAGDNSRSIRSGINSIQDGELEFHPNFFEPSECKFFFSALRLNTEWKQESMNIYGKQIIFPRLTAWYGESDKAYSFSGITLSPKSWTKELLLIKSRIESHFHVEFNSVLLNLYRNGNDSISWHSDAEKELGKNPVIASINFGASRTFQLRHIRKKEKVEVELSDGSVLLMRGTTQHFWQHQVPKTNRIVNERINLTFRALK